MRGGMDIRIIISPAKTMKIDNDSFTHRQMPIYIEDTQMLLEYLQTLTYDELKLVWKCSDKLTALNSKRIRDMDLYKTLTPAIVSFEGLQYQYMGAGTFTYDQLDYIENHLRILSGFYGLVRPFDGIVPYRLEMQSKLIGWEYKSLYDFWGDKIARKLASESTCIIDLASKEYSDSISKHLPDSTKLIKCSFGQLINGKVIEKATLIKMARGEMVSFMAEKEIKDPQGLKEFDRLDYSYHDDLSKDDNYVFIKKSLK